MQPVRPTGQRWFKWINTSSVPCPPFGVVGITETRVVDTEIVFEASELAEPIIEPTPIWDNGVPWYTAFNDHSTVAAGETGWLTVDLPAWALIQESLDLMSFATWRLGDGQRWSLHTLPDATPADFVPYYPGFRVLATRYFPEFYDIWNPNEPNGFLQGGFKIGFVGGLVTELNDSLDVTLPEFE